MIDIDCSPPKRMKMSAPYEAPCALHESRVIITRSGYRISSDELCRICMQCLNELHLNRTWHLMEKESHLSLLGHTAVSLSAVIESGNWDRLLYEILPSMSWSSVEDLEKVKQAVFCFQVLELCLCRDHEQVLACIRRAPDSLHSPLASLLLFTKQKEIQDRFTKLFGEDFSSRDSLRAYIQYLSNAKDWLGEHRLLSIIDSAYSNADDPETCWRTVLSSQSQDRDEISVLTPNERVISFTELVRSIYFRLLNSGCVSSAKALLEESGVLFDCALEEDLKDAVLSGRWDDVHSVLQNPNWHDSEHLRPARQAVAKQQFLELCEAGDFYSALQLLRSDKNAALAPLSRFIMFTDPEQLKSAAHFDGAKGNSRLQLWECLQIYFRREYGVHPVDLLDVLDAAVDFDVKQCNFHNRPKSSLHSLLRRHVCTDHDFPKNCAQVLCGHTDEIWFIAFSEHGDRLASASKDATVRIWEMKHDPELRWYQLHTFDINAKHISYLCWSSDGSYLVTCASKKRAFVWDVNTGFKLCTLRGHREQVLTCAWINTSSPKIATGSVDHQIIIWSLNGECLLNWRTQNAVHNLCVSNDQKYLFASSTEYTVQVYDLQRMELISDFREDTQRLTSLALSRANPLLLVSVLRPSAIHMWRIEDLNCPRIVREFVGAVQDRFIVRCGFGGVDDRFVISGSEDCNVIIWNRHTGERLASLSGHQGTVNSVSWNPTNPMMFASASDDHTIRIWAAQSLFRQRKVCSGSVERHNQPKLN